MAFALISSVTVGSPDGNAITSGAIDTTGANLLVMVISDYTVSGGTVVSDSKGNTWTPRTIRTNTVTQVQIYYSIPTSVGSGHTFTATNSTSPTYPSLVAVAFSGGAAASIYDAENGATGTAVTTLATGSVTPSENGELLIAGLSFAVGDTVTIGSGFTIAQQTPNAAAAHIGVAGAYFIQGTAGALNPAFSWSTSDGPAAAIATFKSAPATSAVPVFMNQYRQRRT